MFKGNRFGKIFRETMLTYNDVVWGYRFFLKREPENDEVIYDKLKRLKSIYELVEEFVNSEEFKQQFTKVSHIRDLEHEMPVSIKDVSDRRWGFSSNMFRIHTSESVESDAIDRILFKHVQDTWQYLGEKEPHYSVLTWDKFKTERFQDNINEFYDSGKPDFERLLNALNRNAIDYRHFKTCLDFGCGVGRVTFYLCKQFERVYGYDISKAHLKEAERYLKDVRNVTLCHLKSLEDLKRLPKVDLIYSVIVLQHNPPPIISLIIREFMKALNNGGIAYFQLPTYHLHYGFNLKDYLNRYLPGQGMEMHILPQRLVFEDVINEGGRIIEVTSDDACGQDFEGVSNTFLVQKK